MQTYVTGGSAAVANAEKEGGFTIVNQASEAKGDLYRAVEGLRGVIAEVRCQGLTPTWDDIKKQPTSHPTTLALAPMVL